MIDQKTSILVNRQVPEFIRDEYPLFITFLEAYYKFLETKQTGEKNDLNNEAKKLRYISDVDSSIDEFESNFFNTYASLLPKDIQVNREFLIKNVLPLYLAKGNEEAFKLLFRMIFNDEVEIILPKNNVLRASDGRWQVDNILRIETDIRSVYGGNGTTKEFILAQTVDSSEITVYIDDVLTEDFLVRKETRKIIFNSAPTNGSTIKIYYDEFDITKLANRKIIGKLSGASAIIEKASKRIITDRLNYGFPFELFIDKNNILGSFISGETVVTDVIDSSGTIVTLEADAFSTLFLIEILDGGAKYNVNDPVFINAGNPTDIATAVVDSVADGKPTYIQIVYGGAGFFIGSNVKNKSGSTVEGSVDAVDLSGVNTKTYYTATNDVIGNYSSVLISSANYGFPSAISENVNTRLCDALTPVVISSIGPISNAKINIADLSSSNSIPLNAQSAWFLANNSQIEIASFGSIGRIDVYGGGSGYKVGDEVIFGANPSGTFGFGAAATVGAVDGTGKITRISVEPPRIGGTANVLNNDIRIIGTSTNFGTDIVVGDKIVIRGQERFVNAISSATSANVNVAFNFSDGTTWANNSLVGSFAAGQVGGANYFQDNFPSVSVSTASGGSGASIAITSIMGDGEALNAISNFVAGQILSIKITSPGAGYQYNPLIDLTNYGDGTAKARAIISNSYVTLPGRWITSDSIISSTERRLQGADYYIDYSYITSSLTEFEKYKQLLKDLLHPAGFVNYSLLNKESVVPTNTHISSVTNSNTISGTVNVGNGSIYITGTNTKFNIANTKGIITIGSNVAVNGEIRTISSFISNTNAKVSSAFTQTSNNQTLIIVS